MLGLGAERIGRRRTAAANACSSAAALRRRDGCCALRTRRRRVVFFDVGRAAHRRARRIHHPVDGEEQRIERGIFGIAIPARQIEHRGVADAGGRRRFNEAGDDRLARVDHALRGIEEGTRSDRGLRPDHEASAAGAQRSIVRRRAADGKSRRFEHFRKRFGLRLVLADTNYENVRHCRLRAPQPRPLMRLSGHSMEHFGTIPPNTVGVMKTRQTMALNAPVSGSSSSSPPSATP